MVIFCRCHPASIVALQERAAVENDSASAEHQVGKVGLDVFAAEVVIGAEAVGRGWGVRAVGDRVAVNERSKIRLGRYPCRPTITL